MLMVVCQCSSGQNKQFQQSDKNKLHPFAEIVCCGCKKHIDFITCEKEPDLMDHMGLPTKKTENMNSEPIDLLPFHFRDQHLFKQ